ncbi:hypothetical protein ACF0H5_003877 [Mactra antiquata]
MAADLDTCVSVIAMAADLDTCVSVIAMAADLDGGSSDIEVGLNSARFDGRFFKIIEFIQKEISAINNFCVNSWCRIRRIEETSRTTKSEHINLKDEDWVKFDVC